MGVVRKTRRGAMLVEKQQWFVRLIGQGVSNSEACRIVGVNRRMGTRWRYGRTIVNSAGGPVHYPPVTLTAPKAEHPRYLSLAERTTIADLRRAGVSVGDIADELGRAASTVSRELRRNTDNRGRYLPATAQQLSTQRRSQPARTRRVTAELYPAPASPVHADVRELAGLDGLVERATHYLDAEQPVRALHLLEIALAGGADHAAALRARASRRSSRGFVAQLLVERNRVVERLGGVGVVVNHWRALLGVARRRTDRANIYGNTVNYE